MSALSDLVQVKKEEIKKTIRTDMSPELAQWVRAKVAVSELPANYVLVVKNALNSGQSVRKRHIANGTVIEVDLPQIEGYNCNLYVAENLEKDVKMARYELWNNEKNIVYVRDLLNVDITDF